MPKQESPQYVLSHYQVEPILEGGRQGTEAVTTSLDLGLTEVDVILEERTVRLPDGRSLSWSLLEEIAGNESACYLLEDEGAHKIQFFSEYVNRVYTLYPTPSAPTMLVSGLPMHRVKGTDPRQDTLEKVRTIAPIRGDVLDTAMGLGYTAIEAGRTAQSVTTIELDPTVVEVCRLNPWSQELFRNPRIHRLMGDAFDVVETLEEASFQRIIHDPPTFSLAGHLYGEAFYRELHRVLSSKGRLFHYIGDLESRSGAGVARGVRQRLTAAGFRRIVDRRRAFGVVAYK